MMDCFWAREEEFFHAIDLADLKDGEVVCDVPSGGCYLGRFIQKNVRLVSVETSIEFVRLGHDARMHQRVLCQDIGCLPLRSQSIDKMISLAGLHHLKDKYPFYEEAYRVLRRGGVLSVADVRKDSGPAKFLNIFVHEYNSMGHQGIFIDDGTQQELEQAGFRVEFAKPIPFFWKFGSIESMANFYKLLFGLNKASPEQVLNGLRTYLGYQGQNGTNCVHWELNYFKAVKR
jgi:SAM-dependent methyltransferase